MLSDDLTKLTEAVRNHPSFPAATKRYISEYIAWRDQMGLLNKVIANAARLGIIQNLIYLHYVKPDDGSASGATFERIAEISSITDQIGSRAVRTLLRLAQTSGLATAGRDVNDARLRVYRPTDALVGLSRNYMVLTLRPLDVVFPHLRICERLESDPANYATIVSALGRGYMEIGLKRPRSSGAFGDLMRLEGAMPIMFVVLDCHFNGRDIPAAPQLSRRFLVSQSQVRGLLKAAEAQGLIRTAARGRLLDAEPLSQAWFSAYARILASIAQSAFGVAPPIAP